jgi:glycosyltransferase involved in cell wall biosynthesis
MSVKVSGFTFIKHGLSLGYPFLESILSIEPLCDEIIINVGFEDPELTKDDGTYEYLKKNLTHQKFIFLKSHWNPELHKHGTILSEQTNIALAACSGDICQYIQGDEVIHENDLPLIHDAMMELARSPQYHGLVFDYLHFYGNTDIVKHTRNIYRREVRTIKNHLNILSWKDAQGFRFKNEEKIQCLKTTARIFHYGWARKEQVMANKVDQFDKLYHGEKFQGKRFFYEKIWGLKKFVNSHPKIMEKWILDHRNEINLKDLKFRHEFKNIGLLLSDCIESLTDYRIGEYKNYKL